MKLRAFLFTFQFAEKRDILRVPREEKADRVALFVSNGGCALN